ncbi:MAG: alpha-glucan family phosphorylase [Phycisphaerae bacterium]
MDIADRLRELARNLYWTWRPELIEIFRDLDPDLFRQTNHNPVEFLSRLDTETLQQRAWELALEARISRAFHQMHAYLEARDTWAHTHAAPLRAQPVAYFSAEFGLHESLPIYSGGLGVLAGDHLKAASDLGLPMVGVGLFYAKGYFHQRLDENGNQREEYFSADVDELPLDWATDENGDAVRVQVACGDETICAGVRAARVGRCRLLLLDSNVEENDERHRDLTDRLYESDPETRLRQEMLLGVGGMRALEQMGIEPGVVHMNEGHSALAALERARQLMTRDARSFEEIREDVAGKCVFTTHTPVEAGHDRFDAGMFAAALRPLREQLGLDENGLFSLGRVNADDTAEPFCMTVLALRMSRYRNGVSARHGRVSRAMWSHVWPNLPESAVPIGHVTNGVHVASWLAIPLGQLYNQLGCDWQDVLHEPRTWQAIDDIDEVEFWEQQQLLKARLVDYVDRRLHRQQEARGETDGPMRLRTDVLTIGFARRFAPYKRAHLLLDELDRLDRLVNDPDRPVQIIFAGKAHPADENGKELIRRVFQVTRDERFAGKVVFLENHDVNVSRHLVQGVDVWLNTPRRPLEACGTSGQKVVLNGGLNVSTLDGWWAEAYDGTNGFAIGSGGEHSDAAKQDDADRESLYEILEQRVVPLYYDRGTNGVPSKWVTAQRSAIRSLPWRFSARRMVMDYVNCCYLPAAGVTTRWFPPV